MKKILSSLLFMICLASFAQVGINTNTPDPSSILDIKSTNKGILIPRVTLKGTDDVTTIANPAFGLMVFNTTFSNNGTTDTSDDVLAKAFYYWDNTKWQQFVSYDNFVQKLNEAAVPRVEVIANYAPQAAGSITTPFLSGEKNTGSANIRQIMFDDTQFDPNGSYNKTNATFTAPRNGMYSFELTLLIRTYNTNALNQPIQITISRPFTNYNLPPNKPDGTNDGTSNWNNASFAILNRMFSTATSTAVNAGFPAYITVKGVQKLNAGQKVAFFTRFITPATSTTTTANNEYSNDVESLNYSRAVTSNVVITYYPL